MKKCVATLCLISLLVLAAGCRSGGRGNANTGTTSQTTAQQQTSSVVPAISYYFPRAGQHPGSTLIGIINSATNTLDIAIYGLTKKDIVSAIVAAKKRGVTVRIITDRQEAASKAQAKELSILKKAGIPIKVNSHKGVMHLKVTIADDSTVTTGSYNYTNEATFDNDEVLVVIRDQGVAKAWESEFGRMWGDTTDYENWSS